MSNQSTMTRFLLFLCLSGFLTSCGLVPAGPPERANYKTVSEKGSDKTIQLYQDLTLYGSAPKKLLLAKGIYKHVASDATHLYFAAPKPPIYFGVLNGKTDIRAIPGGIAISKTMLQSCFVYIDGPPDKPLKMQTHMLGMEFISEEPKLWKRNY
jgi:hypothetical protein